MLVRINHRDYFNGEPFCFDVAAVAAAPPAHNAQVQFLFECCAENTTPIAHSWQTEIIFSV